MNISEEIRGFANRLIRFSFDLEDAEKGELNDLTQDFEHFIIDFKHLENKMMG